MSARNEAIAAMAQAACTQPGACELCQENATKQIDAIPASVLARLAVERGGLARVAVGTVKTGPVYRIAEARP